MPLTNPQRQYLRKLSHSLKPIVQIGKGGLTDTMRASVEQVLLAHELMKLKFVGSKEEKGALIAALVADTRSELVMAIGNTAVLYRQHPQKDKRKIALP
ncbi:MAG: YhbY family RNA-binding protein [Chloroflexota bacterium]